MGGNLIAMYKKEWENFRINLEDECQIGGHYLPVKSAMWARLYELLD